MAKVIQTDLEEDEYMLFTELLHAEAEHSRGVAPCSESNGQGSC
jgi:hypothetical protein